jgi:hypothetical protein
VLTAGTLRNECHATNDNPAPAPSPASHCSRGGLRVLMATSRDGEGRGGYTNERHVTNANPAPTPSTCHHACEPLLTGWVTGATNATRAERTKPNKTNETTHPPPQHLPPHLRATARRVGNRCYGYDKDRTYENEHNKRNNAPLTTAPATTSASHCSQGG